MELRPPLGSPNINSVAGTSRNVGVESSAPIARKSANQEKQEWKDVPRTEILLSVGDRGLKFKKIEDAELYQLQIIDMNSGRVVRKVPPDEMVKIITHLKERADEMMKMIAHLKEQVLEEPLLSDHLDVFA